MITKQDIKKAKQQFVQVPYERPLVEAVDNLIKLARDAGYEGLVQTEKQWEVVGFLITMWEELYPEQARAFYKRQKAQKSIQSNKFASSREKGGAEIRHLFEMPAKLEKLIKAVFPNQKIQDSSFAHKFAKRMEAFRWSEKI